MSGYTAPVKGNDPAVVNIINSYVNQYYSSLGNLKQMEQILEKLESQKPHLYRIPYYEQNYRKVLDQYQKAAVQLKNDAEILAIKSNHSYRQLYRSQKSISSSSVQFLKEIHTESEKKSKTDYLAGIPNKRKESERRENEARTILQRQEAAAKEYSEIDKTFPTQRDQLFKENHAEHLRLSTLYLYKLLQNKDEKGAITFGTAWMQTLPKEAPWNQVEIITVKMLRTTQNHEDLKEFRAAFEQRLRDQFLNDSPAEYLRLSMFYYRELLSNKDEKGALAFGTTWMQTLPKEASLEHVEDMAGRVLSTTQNSEELREFRVAFEGWLREKLLKENSAEYLRLSTLYHQTLWANKDEKSALAFGTTWMQTLPKEASLEQIEGMAGRVLSTTQSPEELKEFCAAFEAWLSEKLLKENSAEYLRLSTLYHQTLWANKDEKAAIAFGTAWMQTLPKEAALEQIEGMAFRTLHITQNREDIKEFCAVFEGWLKGQLFRENSAEYLRISTLYHQELLQIKDEKAAIAFGTSWMRTLPKEASLEQIEGMILRTLRTTQNLDDLKEFCAVFEGWLKGQLFRENSAEYLRISTLYHRELLQNNDEKRALAFGISWIQTLPKETTWEHVNSMTLRMLHITQNQEALKEYRATFEQWLIDHPLSEVPDPASITPELASTPWGQRIYLLGVFHANDPIETLSPETRQLYRNCSALYPNITHWKVHLALYHTLNKEWVEAEQSLAGLSLEDADVKSAQKTLTDDLRERKASAVVDIGLTALNWMIPSSYRELSSVDLGLTAANLVLSNPVRGTWLPSVLGNPERAMPLRYLISPSLVTMGADIIDCIFRNIHALHRLQQAEDFGSKLVRIGYSGWGMYNYTALRTWSAAPNLVGLTISSGQTVMDWLNIRRPPAVQATLSTVQSSAAGIGTVCLFASYSDLAPPLWNRVKQLTGVSKSSSPAPTGSKTTEPSNQQWMFVAAGIGIVALYHLYSHYPYTWAAGVMNDSLREHSEGKYEDAKRVIADSEKTYFVARTRPHVREFAKCLDSLQDYQTAPEDVAKHTTLQVHFSLILEILNKSSHYRGVRLCLLMKKAEIALRKHDVTRLTEAIKEDSKGKVTKSSFKSLLSSVYHSALKNPAAARIFLTKMSPAFPSKFNTEALDKLLEKHAQSLQEWSQQRFPALIKNPPSPQKAEAWDKTFEDLQAFFSKNLGKTAVYQDLQYFRLILSFSQSNNSQTEALFNESGKEAHLRFSQDLILQTTFFRKNRRYSEAADLIKRAQFNAFKHNKLIQDYGQFFILAFLSPSQIGLKQLDRSIAALEPNNELHQELRGFFNAVRIVAALDTDESDRATELLTQEEGSPAEVAAILFERINVALLEKGKEKVLTDLQALENLGPWEHDQLFKAFQVYLSSDTPLEEHAADVLTHLEPLENLSPFVSDLKLQRFILCLSQEKYEVAKNLLNEPMSKELGSEFKKKLSPSLIFKSEELRGEKSLREARETLQHLKAFFSIPNNDVVGHYVNFLICLENLQNRSDLREHLETVQALTSVLGEFDSPSLRREKVDILNTIAHLALREGQRQVALQALNTALADLEPLKKAGIDVTGLETFIRDFQKQFIASSN